MGFMREIFMISTFSLFPCSLVFFILLIADVFHFSLSEESEEYFAEQEEPEEVQRAHH